MAMTNVRQYFLDTIVELTGVKSGLAVTIPQALGLLDADESSGWWHGESEGLLRVDFDEFQESFIRVLHGVGAISDRRGPQGLLVELCRNNTIVVPEEDDGEEFFSSMPPLMQSMSYLESVVTRHLLGEIQLPRELASLPAFDCLLQEYELRDVMSSNMPTNRKWDGITKLSDLFESESAPANSDAYFDQRFIDYLHAQPGDITRMHWRQFEHLTAEFFRRLGYRVTIGPGRNDGGKDVVAVKDHEIVGPEMIYIQCKRLGEGYEVEIDHVKALWATISDDRVTRGMIAATSRLATGAKSYCDARSYRLKAAEGDNIKEWIRHMASHGEG